MTMKTLECTVSAVEGALMRVTPAAAVRPAVQSAVTHPLLPTVRSHSTGGVRLYEVKDLGRGVSWAHSLAAKTGIDFTTFPTRLGPPPDSPPVN
ncbi:hypothetical protein [Microlunatus phosphovorus]|nr:hypothetical protein [Microlunatus phosphovorus]